MPLSNFKRLLKRGDSPGTVMLHKQGAVLIEPLEDRCLRFTISTGSIDREGDTIAVGGWDLSGFAQNPVVLWGHDADLPIAKCVEIGVIGDALKAAVEFAPADMPVFGPLAEAVLRMSRTGFLSATSVGFRPLEFEIAKDRNDGETWWPPVNFIRSELLEFSIVSIPANPEALIDPAEQAMQPIPTATANHQARRRPLTTLEALTLGHSTSEIVAMRRTGEIIR